jgi:hypothetical protein
MDEGWQGEATPAARYLALAIFVVVKPPSSSASQPAMDAKRDLLSNYIGVYNGCTKKTCK